MHDIDKSRAEAHYAAKRYADCVAVCDAALVEDPNDAEAHRTRAAAVLLLGRDTEAIEGYSRAIELDCRPKDLYLRASIWIDLDEMDRAIEDARRLIEVGEREGTDYCREGAFLMLAVAYHYQGRRELCRVALKEVRETSIWWCKGKVHTVAMLRG